MIKNRKVLLIAVLLLALIVGGISTLKIRENRIKEANVKIEKLVKAEEYKKLALLFNDFDKVSKIFGVTEEQCYEIEAYFNMLQSYKEKNYERTYDIAKELDTKKCWIFENDASKFKKEFLDSKEAKAIEKKIKDEEKLAKEIENLRKYMEEWGREHISEIAPYIGMPESLISKTMLDYQDDSELINIEYRENIYIYEKHYMWKDDKENEICKVVVGQEEYEYEPEVKEVEFLGNNWKKKVLYSGNDENLVKEFTVGIYTGKLYEENNDCGYNNIKTDEELFEEYEAEYDVYEYSDADEFYYDHQDDFEGYEDAEQYYEDAWSIVE